MKYLGFDPSLCNWGWVLADYSSEQVLTILDMGTIRIPKPESKGRANRAFQERVGELYRQVSKLPYTWVDGIFAEAPTGSQSASSRDSYAACNTILAVVEYTKGIPVYTVKPKEVKAVSSNPKATKRDMVDWATFRYPHELWKVRGNDYCLNNEHQADALAAIVAGLRGIDE